MDTLVNFLDLGLFQTYGDRLFWGLVNTVRLVLTSCAIGFLLAYPICRARMSANPLLSWPAMAYITFFRGTPLLCQVYIVYYGGGALRHFFTDAGVWWFFRDAYYCCIFTFSLNTSAYQAEIIRGALRAVPKGQVEAARALGLSNWRIGRHVVWPQAMLVALPPFGNEFIAMVKASAIAAIVTVMDFMGATRFVFARTFDFAIYVYAALVYLMITETVRRVWKAMERGLSRHLVAARGRDPAPAGGAVAAAIIGSAAVQ